MIDCSNVRFTYDGERFVLRGIDLHIADGEFVCILGGNGSGKSTLAKHMNALLVPDEGCVRVAGHDTQDEEYVYDIRSTAGMVFQNPDDQLVASLVEDDVAFGPENLGVESAHIAERVKQALKEVGLVGFERHETHALSRRTEAARRHCRRARHGATRAHFGRSLFDARPPRPQRPHARMPRAQRPRHDHYHDHSLHGRSRGGRSRCGHERRPHRVRRHARRGAHAGRRAGGAQPGRAVFLPAGLGAPKGGHARCATRE